MPFYVPKNEDNGDGDFEKPPEGMHAAICCWVVDLGSHLNRLSQKYQPKVLLTFELPRLLMKDDRPFVASAQYTNSFYGSSYLKSHLTTWFGKTVNEDTTLDLFTLVGRHATVQISHSEDGKWANIIGISPPQEADKVLMLNNPEIAWTFGQGGLPEELPDWIKTKVMQSREWNEQGQQNEGPAIPKEDDVPF
jgi:hypothetical protein